MILSDKRHVEWHGIISKRSAMLSTQLPQPNACLNRQAYGKHAVPDDEDIAARMSSQAVATSAWMESFIIAWVSLEVVPYN